MAFQVVDISEFELEMYFLKRMEMEDDGFDILYWWKKNIILVFQLYQGLQEISLQ